MANTDHKRSVFIEEHGAHIGTVLAGANWHDSPLLEATLACLARFAFYLPDQITVHLDASYDPSGRRETLTVLGFAWQISPKDAFTEINHTNCWMLERTDVCRNRSFGILQLALDRIAAVQQA